MAKPSRAPANHPKSPFGREAQYSKGRSPAKSAIANGRLLPTGSGHQTQAWCRRTKELIADHMADFGGVDNCSAAERSIIRRACVLTVELERLELKFAVANQASSDELDLYQRTAGNLRRLLEAVSSGLSTRRARDITPCDPLDYARSQAAE